MNKNTKKTIKPTFVVDATKCENGSDLKFEFILAKAGKVIITEDELEFVIEKAIDTTIAHYDLITNVFNAVNKVLFGVPASWCTKKTPWYKRFWNWLTRKN